MTDISLPDLPYSPDASATSAEARSAAATSADNLAASELTGESARRTEEILRLADQEAAAVRAQANQDAEAIREQAHRDADTVRAQAQSDAADTRLAALEEADSLRRQALTDAEERRADLEREADELVLSVWWLAERVRAAAGKAPRDMPRVDDDLATVAVPGDETGGTDPVSSAQEGLARHSALRQAAVAAQRARRTTEAAQEEAQRTLARARREAEELLNQSKAEAEHQITKALAESERATVLAQRRVESLNRERDGILTSLTELTQHTAATLNLSQTHESAWPKGRSHQDRGQ